MAYDGIMMHRIIDQLNQEIVSGRVNRIYQISKYEMLMTIRSHQKNKKLLLSAHPMYARIQLTSLEYPTPEMPNALTMLFRKCLEGAYIKSITQIDLDRICKITFSSYNELGDLQEINCYIEVMGKHSNIILCNEDNKIIDCIKRITPHMNSTRFLQPGATYQFPFEQNTRLDPLTSEFVLDNNLTKVYQGISPILSREILYRIDHGEDFKVIMKTIDTSNTIYLSQVDQKEFFHLIPLSHLQVPSTTYHLFDGLDQHYELIDQKERIKQQTANLQKFIDNEYQKNVLKLQKLTQTLYDSKNSDHYRIMGDLLFSNLHLIQKGMKEVKVENYYDNTTLDIPLDPKLDGKQNANKYYHKYQKAKKSIQVLQQQIELTEKEIEYFDSLLDQMKHANYYDALEIKEELEQLNYIKKKKSKSLRKNKKPHFERYFTKDGIEINIGKNNFQNDYLTFKASSRYDMWFHVKDMPGSHVVVKAQNLDEYTIRLASNIAAYYSKGKNSSSVPVNYTLIKTLKKPAGQKPGKVILDHYKTIYIDPDDSFKSELIKK